MSNVPSFAAAAAMAGNGVALQRYKLTLRQWQVATLHYSDASSRYCSSRRSNVTAMLQHASRERCDTVSATLVAAMLRCYCCSTCRENATTLLQQAS
jgi:hypothetical protein